MGVSAHTHTLQREMGCGFTTIAFNLSPCCQLVPGVGLGQNGNHWHKERMHDCFRCSYESLFLSVSLCVSLELVLERVWCACGGLCACVCMCVRMRLCVRVFHTTFSRTRLAASPVECLSRDICYIRYQYICRAVNFTWYVPGKLT